MMGARTGQASGNAGLPSGNAQASAKTQTGSPAQPDGPIALDLSKTYILNPNKPNEVFTGSEILNSVGRGNLASQKQSQLDKTLAELDAARNRESQIAGERDLLRKQVEERQSMENFERMAREMGLVPAIQQQAQDDYEDMFSDREPTGIDPRKVVRQLTDMERNVISKAENTAKEVALRTNQELENQRRQVAENQRRAQDFIDFNLQNTINTLKSEMPDIDPGEIESLARNMIVGSTLQTEAKDEFTRGNIDEANKLYTEANTRMFGAMSKHGELKLKQMQTQFDAERQAQIQMFSTGGPEPEGQGYTVPTVNKREAEKRWNERIAKAKNIEKQLDKLNPV